MDKSTFRIEPAIPETLQGILWSKNVKNLDLEKDKVYIIHQVLSYGNLNQIKWLCKIYKLKEIQEVFLKYPKKVYTPSVFYFVKNIILNLNNRKLLAQNYIKILFQTSVKDCTIDFIKERYPRNEIKNFLEKETGKYKKEIL